MSDETKSLPVVENPWRELRRFTAARIALGRTGISLPTKPHLEFQLAHARARNAVHHSLDAEKLAAVFRTRGYEAITLNSAAATRPIYLQRPDLGRRLDAASRAILESRTKSAKPYDIAFVIADGLSALAIEENAVAFIDAVMAPLRTKGLAIAPLAIVSQGRVAIGDEIGELLGARIAVVAIGERPGLSSPDSMGLYMTFAPRPGLTDEARNCISNVRTEGCPADRAADKLVYLLGEAQKRNHSGVHLKDESEQQSPIGTASARRNFLISAD
jgi:ethanolamine ammonia-lyase small subunit